MPRDSFTCRDASCAPDDLDESGLIDDETELNLLVTNVCFYAHREHSIEVNPNEPSRRWEGVLDVATRVYRMAGTSKKAHT